MPLPVAPGDRFLNIYHSAPLFESAGCRAAWTVAEQESA